MKKVAMLAVLAALVAGVSFGAALSTDRDTPTREGGAISLTQGSNVIYRGSLVAVNSSQLVVPASDATGLKVIGRAEKRQDNTGTSYVATRAIEVKRGIFRWANGGSFTDAHIGDLAFVSDDQTVCAAASATYDIIAGVIIDVDADGVWVDTHHIGSQGAGSLTTLTTSSNAAIGGTLAVTGASTLTGALAANGGINCDSGKFTVADTSGNTAVGGTLAVTGASTLTGASTFNGAVTMTNAVIKMTGLPTSTNGLASGTLWLNSNAIEVMP